MVGDDAYHLERVRKRDEERAIALLRAHVDKSYSLCNTLSFVAMESLRIREAVAFDRHFRASAAARSSRGQGSMPTRDELHAAIAREQGLIPRLERQREEAPSRVRSLHAVLDKPAEGAEGTSRRTSPPATAAEKVALFRGRPGLAAHSIERALVRFR